jgi:CheY-like chemotaxis protein
MGGYRPEVVLTDALMPKVDGRDLCRTFVEACHENYLRIASEGAVVMRRAC